MKLPKSIKIGYATFFHHVRTPELLRARSSQLFEWISDGKLKIRIGREYALADAAKAPRRHGKSRDHGQAVADPIAELP